MRDVTDVATDLVAERDHLMGDLSAAVQTLDEYRDVLADCPGVRPIRAIAQEVKAESDALLEEGRLLRLGIVGQIKAGKSTLLNLLLFDGREVLPRAATPMTASLTHIVRNESVGTDQAEIEVEYYSLEEWQEIETHAAECRKAKEAGRTPADFLEASHELVEMAQKRRIAIIDHPDTDTRSSAIDDLNGQLRSLVGADGELTPLVKSVTIRCGQGIPNLDIVDTPGLNDPIRSRVRATQRLLAKCDAVLLLSYAGQFMGGADGELLRNTLPAEGITKSVIIGSKFDSALVDEASRHSHDLQEAAETVERQLMEHAHNEIRQTRNNDGRVSIDRDDVLFMSAMCAILATKDQSKWSADEHAAFDALRQSYPDWLDSPMNGAINDETKDNLRCLVGKRARVDDRINRIRGDRDEIIWKKVGDYLRQKRLSFGTRMMDLIDHLNQDQDQIRNATLDQLYDRQRAAHEMIEKITDEIVDIWATMVNLQKHGISKIEESCNREIEDARKEVTDSVRVKTRREEVNKPAGFLGVAWLCRALIGRQHSYTKTYEEKVMDENMMRTALDVTFEKIRSAIRDEFDSLFDHAFVRDVTRKLRSAVADILDNETATEIASSIKRSVNRAVEETAERARRDIARHRSEGIARIEVNIRDDKEAPISQAQALDYVSAISDVIYNRVVAAKETVDDAIKRAKPELVPEVTGDIKKYYERLGRDIADREFKLQRYEQARMDLGRHGECLTRSA